jgi:hypothetical protein
MTLFFTTSRLQRPLFLNLFSLLSLTAALHGCGGQTPSTSTSTSTDTDTADTPASCPNADLAGYKALVYVAASGADSDSCGDKPASACASLAKGIARCGVAGCAVLVQHGLYPTTASLSLRDAVSVHGSCRFGDEPERHYRTVVAASPAVGTPAIDASGINSATALTGLVVLGKPESAPGEASIAMRVSASKGLTMTGVTLVAGRGGDGAPGVSRIGGPGGNGGQADGLAPGGQACPSGQPVMGGNGGAGSSFSNFAFDRFSCLFECTCTALPSAGSPDQMAGQASRQARGGGSGGAGLFGGACSGRGSRGPAPTDGTAGAAGELGACSTLGGKAIVDKLSSGRFVAGRWLAGRGGQGGAGSAGSGAGGGGAGGYSMFIRGINDFLTYDGFPGGGGGGGGCGAPESTGGQQGGASIPLVMANATITGLSTDVSLVPGPGGAGGNAAGGSTGGPGGAGGDPYQATRIVWAVDGQNVYMPGAGAPGGAGGPGGAGAGAAGGNGGPSFGIALIGNVPDPGHGVTSAVYPGTPGTAGSRGVGAANPAIADNINSNCRSADGEDGLPASTAPVMRFEDQS